MLTTFRVQVGDVRGRGALLRPARMACAWSCAWVSRPKVPVHMTVPPSVGPPSRAAPPVPRAAGAAAAGAGPPPTAAASTTAGSAPPSSLVAGLSSSSHAATVKTRASERTEASLFMVQSSGGLGLGYGPENGFTHMYPRLPSAASGARWLRWQGGKRIGDTAGWPASLRTAPAREEFYPRHGNRDPPGRAPRHPGAGPAGGELVRVHHGFDRATFHGPRAGHRGRLRLVPGHAAGDSRRGDLRRRASRAPWSATSTPGWSRSPGRSCASRPASSTTWSVEEPSRGQGIATRLLEAAAAWLEDHGAPG